MSGALVSLVAKGSQDVYLTNNESESSFFKSKFTRYTNFSQAPKRLDYAGTIQNNGITSVFISSYGDLINQVWLEGVNIVQNISGTVFDLYIGGQKIDSQPADYMSDIWQIYMSETYSKSGVINNNISQKDKNFFPLHFFFCDNEMFLPLVAIVYHQIEIRITWGPNIQNVSNVIVYGNYIFLDTKEREELVAKPQIDMVITQVQTIHGSLSSIDLSAFNHPIKSIYFGYPQNNDLNAYWSFNTVDILLNGTYLLEQMSPTYFHSVQGYYNTTYGTVQMNNIHGNPFYTRYFTYNFCLDASSYKPTGTCNFSRLDNAVLKIHGAITDAASPITTLTSYAVNYNILRLKAGISGILFSN